jgi:hypothetical protein
MVRPVFRGIRACLLGRRMLVLAAWLAEFLLESFGSYFAFRRRILPLGFYLLFRAISDAAAFIIMYSSHGGDVYAWAYWIQQAGAALLLCWLCVAVMAQMVGEGDYQSHAILLSILGVAAVAIGALRANSVTGTILGAAITADLFLGLAMLAGLLSKKSHMSAQWTAIAWAACIQLGSEGIIRKAAHHDERALAWLPLGAIVALVVWIAGAWPEKKDVAEEAQEVAPQLKFEPGSFTIEEERYRGWVN